MVAQDLLDFIPRSRLTDPDTSHEAAAEIAKSGAGDAQRDLCVKAVTLWPGRTTAELAELMVKAGWPVVPAACRWMVARRCPEARRLGLVESGSPRKCTATGKRAMTWTPRATV